MSLKNYMAQIEQLNEAQLSNQPINGQQPMNGQPQQGTTPPAAGVTPPQTTQQQQALAQGQQTGQQQQQPQQQGQQPQQGAQQSQIGQPQQGVQPGQPQLDQNGQPMIREDGAQQVTKDELAEVLDELERDYPHEVKMFKEGWGMDESLYERVLDHAFKHGKIPREKFVKSDRGELRSFIEEMYAKHCGIIQETNEETELNPAVDFQSEVGVEEGIADRIGDRPAPETDPAKQNHENVPAYVRKRNEQGGVSSLEQRLKETDMFESKGKTEKTKSGLKHTGTYGKEYETDIEGNEKKIDKSKDAPKKGRGRPKKDGGETGKGFDTSALTKAFGSKKPKKEIGKVSAKHKLSDKEPVDESIAMWDQQLKTLLEGKQINEGITVSTSMGQGDMSDSVSVSATDEDAHTLLKIIHDAGLGVQSDPKEELLKAHGMFGSDEEGEGGSFSVNPEGGEEGAGEIEVVDFDSAQDGLEGGDEDNGDDTLAQIKKMLGIGVDSAPEPKHPEGFDGEDSSDEESDDEESDDEEGGDDYDGEDKEVVFGDEESDEESDEEETDDDIEESDFDQQDAEEPMDQDAGEEEQVEEGKQTCNECGAMYEGEGHECEHGDEQLNEWANSREGMAEDDRFFATVKFMTGDISGGLNGQKKDQTVMPHTAVKVIEAGDVAAQMKKLAGI